MISLVSTLVGLVASLLIASTYPVAGYAGLCKQTCEKYRKTDEAFTLDCDEHRDDIKCLENCMFCKYMCTDHSPIKVYSCPENPDKKIDTGAYIATIVWFAIAGGLLFVVVGGIICSVCLSKYRRDHGVVRGAPKYSRKTQQSRYYPTMGKSSESSLSTSA